jgi:hypothetical protein
MLPYNCARTRERAWMRGHRFGNLLHIELGNSAHRLKIKNPAAPAVKREAEEEWR